MLKDEVAIWKMAHECASKCLPCALAIVIEAVGSTPQRSGAKLLMLEDGSIMGTVGGGMVEALTVEAAMECIKRKGSRLIIPRTSSGDERHALQCGGRMSVFIDGCLEKHSDVICALLETVNQRGNGCLVVHMAFRDAELASHEWMFVKSQRDGCLSISDDKIASEGLDELLTQVCLANGGATESHLERRMEDEWIYVEPVTPPLRLVVVGAGHVGKCVAQVGSLVGLEVVVIDDRADFARRDMLPFVDAFICDDIVAALTSLNIDERTFVVIVTRSHELDERALEVCLNTNAGYIGMMGSRLKVRRIFNSLLEKGIDEEQLKRVHAPIGMEIGAITPMELAISIVAEVIALYRGALKRGGSNVECHHF